MKIRHEIVDECSQFLRVYAHVVIVPRLNLLMFTLFDDEKHKIANEKYVECRVNISSGENKVLNKNNETAEKGRGRVRVKRTLSTVPINLVSQAAYREHKNVSIKIIENIEKSNKFIV